MGQYICFCAMCDIVASHKCDERDFYSKTLITWHNMSYRTYRLCPIITFLAFKSGLATTNHIGLLIVCFIINIFPFYFQARICDVFYAWDRHHNLLVLTHYKLMTNKPQFFINYNFTC